MVQQKRGVLKNKKKIAIVCGHFIPNLGYIEVYLAKKAAEQNYDVCVFTSNKIPAYVRNIAQTGKQSNLFKIVQLPAWFSLGQMVLSNHLVKTIQTFNPDTIVVIGVGKLFPYAVYQSFENKEIITLFGDNMYNYNLKSGGIITRLKQKLLDTAKNYVYRQALKKSAKLIGYTPETKELLLNRFAAYKTKINKKYRFVSLGFDDDIYYFDEKLRQQTRLKLAIDETVLTGITVTRFHKNKQIEKIISFVEILNRYIPVRYIFAGAGNDAYSEQIKALIKRKKLNEKILLLPFENDKSKINALYNAADFGIWTQPAISIIEAKGTGLPVFLPREKSLQHLAGEHTGLFYSYLDDTFAQKCCGYIRQLNRKAIVKANQWLNYRFIINQIIDNDD